MLYEKLSEHMKIETKNNTQNEDEDCETVDGVPY